MELLISGVVALISLLVGAYLHQKKKADVAQSEVENAISKQKVQEIETNKAQINGLLELEILKRAGIIKETDEKANVTQNNQDLKDFFDKRLNNNPPSDQKPS